MSPPLSRPAFDLHVRNIRQFFEWSEKRVWSRADLLSLVAERGGEWGLAGKPAARFTELLKLDTPLSQIELAKLRPVSTRFGWGRPSALEVATSLSDEGYFAYETALYLNGLVPRPTETVYFNIEQPSSGYSTGLSQPAIDRAFQQPPRITNNRVSYDDVELCIPNGKFTGGLGIINQIHPKYGRLRFTSLERSLIDIAVRPEYSGGTAQVLDAYRAAAKDVSVPDLVSTLERLGHAYPYHQVVGFYLHRAGCHTLEELEELQSLGTAYKFYLDRQMESPAYCKTWHISYPSELNS